MSKENYHRFGDTAFRMKHQISFYNEIFQFICNQENHKCDINSLKEYVYQEIVNYKREEKVDHKKMIIKQLEKFELVYLEGEIINLTNVGLKFYEIIKNTKNNEFYVNTFLWFYIMINSPYKTSEIFKEFVQYVYKKNIDEISDDLFTAFITAEGSFIADKKPTILRLNENKINQILEENDIQKVVHRQKPYSVNKTLPQLINIAIKSENKKHDISQVLDNDKKLSSVIKKIFLLVTKKNKIKNNHELIEFIINEGKNLINHVIEHINYNTIKDYKDINLRFFVDINFVYKDTNKKIRINQKYKKNFLKLLNVKFDKNLDNFKSYISNIKDPGIKIKQKYPYNIEQIKEMMGYISKEKWNELKEKYKDDFNAIANPTIFEYLITLFFFVSLNHDVNKFINCCNTKLNAELKPSSHATGGKPDGIFLDKDGNVFATIESTILCSLESIIKNEATSIQRHCYNQFKDKENKYVIFVTNQIKSEDKAKLIYYFMDANNSKYFDNPNIKITILCLTIEELIKNIEVSKINEIFNELPINFLINNSEVYKDEIIKNKYNNLISTINSFKK